MYVILISLSHLTKIISDPRHSESVLGDDPWEPYMFFKRLKLFLFHVKKHHDLDHCFSDIKMQTSHQRRQVLLEQVWSGVWNTFTSSQVILALVLVPNSTLSSCVLDTPKQEAAAFPTAVIAKVVHDIKISNHGRGKWKWDWFLYSWVNNNIHGRGSFMCHFWKKVFFSSPKKEMSYWKLKDAQLFFPHWDGHLASLGSSFSYVVWGMTVPNHVYSSASQNGPQMCRAQRDSAL